MKNTTLTILIASFLLFFTPLTALSEAIVGEKAPSFMATDSNGKSHDLKDFLGKTVVLEWTNHNCPFVRKHYDTKNMQDLQKKYTDAGVVWLTINSSAMGKQGYVDAEGANGVIKDENASPSAYLLDASGEIGKRYGAKTTPHMFIIDSKGMIAYAGAIDDNSSSRQESVEGAKNHVAEALDSLIAGQPVKVAATQSYGCSVKYAS